MDSNAMTTEHLILRSWKESDLQDLYRCISNKSINEPAGLRDMKDPDDCRTFLKYLIDSKTHFAICLKDDPHVIGHIGLRAPDMDSDCAITDELEMGAWIDVPFWGKGYITEAVRRMLRYSFEELNCSAVWAAYYPDNEGSRRVLEKCGFSVHHTEENRYVKYLDAIRTEIYTRISKEEWISREG